MRLLIFDLRGSVGHFRRPDTMGTQASYPFITRTAIRGLVGSILGLERGPSKAWCGVRLMSPVRTVAQELSLHGKSWVSGGDAKSFNRPTAIELVINPHYRVYYAGEYQDELASRIRNRKSCYHTYLGSAFCLTFPEWVREVDCEIPAPEMGDGAIRCVSVVPSRAVKRLVPQPQSEYARVGGLLKDYLGERRFRGTLSVLYEVSGGPIDIYPEWTGQDAFWQFCRVPEEGWVCLW